MNMGHGNLWSQSFGGHRYSFVMFVKLWPNLLKTRNPLANSKEPDKMSLKGSILLLTNRNKEQEEWKIEIRRFEERMENLREELRKERDKSQKKTTKDLVEVNFTDDYL